MGPGRVKTREPSNRSENASSANQILPRVFTRARIERRNRIRPPAGAGLGRRRRYQAAGLFQPR